MTNTAAAVMYSYQNGAGGLASSVWHDKSGFIPYMHKDENYTYYSNSANAVYVLTGVRTYYPPKKKGPYMYGVLQFRIAVSSNQKSYIIWFEGVTPQTIYNLEDISLMFELEEEGRFEGGKVYRIIK